MMRGQAFDTFKLMIAAVVAVAILGILLGILGGISPIGQDFGNTAKQMLSSASQSPGMVKPSAGEVNFQKDSIYPSSMFTTAAGGRTVKFDCGSLESEICDDSGSQLEIKGNFHTKIYVCCEEDVTGNCKVGIGTRVSC